MTPRARSARALAVALVLTAACGTSDDDEGTGSSPAHLFCVSETNRYRMSAGKPELAFSAELEAYANEGARVDFTSSPHHHFTSTNGGGIALAENECPQQGNWERPAGAEMSTVVGLCIKAFFDEGPGGPHYENMMGPYQTIGCGIYEDNGRVTIVQDLGQ